MIDLRTKPGCPDSEESLHKKCMEFTKKSLLAHGLPQLAHHCPSGGQRSKREASAFKLMGVIPGVPDIFIPFRTPDHSGLYVELKNHKGKPSPAQIDFMEGATQEGFLCVVVNDLETYKEVVTEYLNQR